MTTPVRLVGFLLGLLAVFVAARGVGAVTGPVAGPASPMVHDEMSGDEEAGHGDHGEDAASETPHAPGGLQVSEQGYTFEVLSEDPLRFVIDDPEGHAVQAYDLVHEKPMHLIVVGRDLSGYQHVHPTLSDDGVWSVDLDLAPGTTRLIADFTPREGPALILGTDVQVAGDYAPAEPTSVRAVDRVDGYRVRLAGALVPGESSSLTATVRRNGRQVMDLQPYLGAYGHLVALREGDLAYLHMHPEEAGPGPEIPFLVEVPSAGRYRLHLDFRHGGTVHTVSFTQEAFGHGH